MEFLSLQSNCVYFFRSAVGTFWILQKGRKDGDYIGDEGIIELLGYHDSAFAAYESVSMQLTGWDGWDRRAQNNAPPMWSKKLLK